MYRSDMYIPVYSDQDYWELRDFTDVFSGEQDTFFEDTSPSGINLFTAVFCYPAIVGTVKKLRLRLRNCLLITCYIVF